MKAVSDPLEVRNRGDKGKPLTVPDVRIDSQPCQGQFVQVDILAIEPMTQGDG